ncbi:MAG: nucleotidyltransferase domain-containing protein [Patescibacteria group bacterium]
MIDIKLMVLFGSKATNSSGRNSDTDIAVLANHPLSLQDKIDLAETISKEFKVAEGKIDLIDLWQAPPLLQFEIAKNGKLLEGSEFDFLRFKVLAWKRYQDTKKLRQAREESLKTRVYVR